MRIICGRHAVKVALAAGAVTTIYLAAGTNPDLLAAAQRAKVAVKLVGRAELTRRAATPKHQNVVAAASQRPRQGWPELCAASAAPLLLVLDGIEDPRNLGACLRSAAAFGVTAIICPSRRSAPLSPAARKVASGAAEHVPLVAVVNLARELRRMREAGFTLIGAVQQGGADVFGLKLEGPLALVMGGEAKGLRRLTREACDQLASIPMANAAAVESLNVAVACGICLAALASQRT